MSFNKKISGIEKSLGKRLRRTNVLTQTSTIRSGFDGI